MVRNGVKYERYLGDGVYVGHDGFQFWIGTERTQWEAIALEDSTLASLLRYVEQKLEVTITIKGNNDVHET